MNDHIDESSTTTKTFRFGSGQLLTLNEYQIEKIPYLTALVSAGSSFDSIKVDEEYYLLDSRIDYQDFLFVLDSISFHSIRQIFIHLSKNYNILAIIALMDFLAIEHERNPTLEEVNSSFFWNVEFGDKLNTYQFICRSSNIQDMAVRFAIAMAKEEYDFRNRQVINQIYWFIMFILSAYQLFETNLRYHVHKIAQNCFSIYCPSLLECLNRLEQRIEKEIRETSITTGTHIDPHKENNFVWHLNVFTNDCKFHVWDVNQHLCIIRRLGLTFRRCSCNKLVIFFKPKKDSTFFSDCRKKLYNMDKSFEHFHQKTLENMYKCLLDTVLEQVPAETHGQKFAFFDELKHKSILDDILNSNTVQIAIQENILSEICELASKLKRKYVKVVEAIQVDERNPTIQSEDERQNHSLHPYWNIDETILKRKQNEALEYELTLNKLHQYESVIDEIRNAILVDLHDLFMDEIQIFVYRQEEIRTLINSLSFNREKTDNSIKIKENT